MPDVRVPPVSDEDDVDACLCGSEIVEPDRTADEDLPVSYGGVAHVEAEDFDNDTSGPDVEISEANITADEDLPAATGGVLARP